MNIPTEALETAAALYWDRETGDDADLWEDIDPEMQADVRERVLEILEAAAPHIAAQALREASAAYPLETAYGGAEHAVNWLRDRAEQIEAVPTGAASVIPKENQ